MAKHKSMKCDLANLSDQPASYYQNQREDMLKYIPQDIHTSLEFGCGCGAFSALIRKKFNTESWGVEIQKEAAQEAAQELDKVLNSAALESLVEIPENYFNCIILFDILEHLVNPYSLLRGLKSKLTSRGVIVASIPNIRYYRTLVDFVIHGNWDYKDKGILDKTHLRFFTHNSILKMFDTLGYRVFILEGIHPTHSRTFRLLNIALLNSLSDVRYRHFIAVVRPKLQEQ